MKREIKLVSKIKLEDMKEINKLVASFEFEIDNFPNSFEFPIYVINKCNQKNIDWRSLLISELIEVTNSMFRRMKKVNDFEPLIINFNFLSSLFWSPRFGFKIKRKGC